MIALDIQYAAKKADLPNMVPREFCIVNLLESETSSLQRTQRMHRNRLGAHGGEESNKNNGCYCFRSGFCPLLILCR